MQRRQSDQNYERDLNSLLTAAANNSQKEFQTIYARLRPEDQNWQAAYENARRAVLEEQMMLDAQGAAAARIAGNLPEMNRHIRNLQLGTEELKNDHNEADAPARFFASVLTGIRDQAQSQGWNAQQIQTAQQDALMAAQGMGYDPAALIDAAVSAGIQFDPNTRPMSNPNKAEDEAHNVLDMIRINAMILSGENMRRINEISQQLTGERDPRTRRQLEEERNERSREVTRQMGGEGVRGNSEEGGGVRISDRDVGDIVNAHMDLVIRLHTHQLDQVSLSKTNPRMAG